MQPSKTLQHQGWGTWWPPHTEHAYFSWSAGQPGSVPPDSKLAQEALKAGEHIHSSGGGVGGPPRGTSNVHYNYYGGRRPFRYGGFGGGGFGRRIFYFALGWGVADYYYSRHRRAERKAQQSSSPPTDSRVQDAPQPRRFEWPSHCRREQVNTTPNTPPSSPSPVYQYAPTPSSAPISTTVDHPSEIVKQLEQMKVSPAPKEITPVESKASIEHVWGWGARRRQRREAQAAEEKKAKELVSPEADPDLMARLEETAKKFWEDKESVSAGLRDQADQKRREVAREKLDKLSAALETLRESLGEEQDSRKARRV